MDRMSKQMADMLQAQVDAMSSPALTDAMAKFAKNYFDSLVKQGFSKADAMEIVKANQKK